MTDAGEVWRTCSELLQIQVSEATWRAWFTGLEPEDVDDECLTLSAPSALVRERIEERYSGLIQGVLEDELRRPLRVKLLVRRPMEHLEEAPAADDPNGTGPLLAEHEGRREHSAGGDRAGDSDRKGRGHAPAGDHDHNGRGMRPPPRSESPVLNPRYRFEAFVIGATNRFAHAAAQRVAEKPAASYNPLFIHGDSGLGKTHLLHAIGHYVADNFPQMSVRYVSTETFMNDFVDAIRTNGQSSFKRRYRDCDVLLVDDIQFMEGKEGLQEEFFHTFNSLYEGARQIVLSSDRHPRSIATLEDRLRSRFEWGLITDVQPPELETRLAILRKKAESERVPIPPEVLELIATHVRDNIRELEGALIRVSAFASLNNKPLTIDVAETVLSDILDAGRPRQITPKVILETTATMFDFSVDDICGTSRRRPLVNARQIGMYVFRELTDFSYPAIAREFGGRDHTTVIHAVEKVSRLMMERRQTYDQVTELIHRIKGGTS
ncbi:chromosomal replication initiator protein DnaA [Acidiferrimicrobium sp. IK]|uniref:chromosomal replication initiator protein DnaA n=1 Tax=Acidiferrimicrobium sp. IK TaxID=2871700 RepID=UPI0021CB20A5|nr:chromosomal replication initiator protein DnaA [Acidiferrimicrobium sp. IK]